GGSLRLERNQALELGYQVIRGSRKYSVGVYNESVSDAAFTMSAPSRFLPTAELIPDLDSPNFVFNVGSYTRMGYSAAMTQSLGAHADVALAGGRGGALIADPGEGPAASAAGIRSQVRKTERVWATARASMTVPGTGTHFVTSYGWTDFRALMP